MSEKRRYTVAVEMTNGQVVEYSSGGPLERPWCTEASTDKHGNLVLREGWQNRIVLKRGEWRSYAVRPASLMEPSRSSSARTEEVGRDWSNHLTAADAAAAMGRDAPGQARSLEDGGDLSFDGR